MTEEDEKQPITALPTNRDAANPLLTPIDRGHHSEGKTSPKRLPFSGKKAGSSSLKRAGRESSVPGMDLCSVRARLFVWAPPIRSLLWRRINSGPATLLFRSRDHFHFLTMPIV
ncbi:hypothetical protein CDAR_496051 [Caerostris darwini]|uniref:Uncharacterized protein n=1 Tax=Caerostris darwini TaxID=1538125 RepID=A0AAV4U1T4_9ARAC|nr:hypothetical protein CDAR_496051 [Caerostris darwini]